MSFRLLQEAYPNGRAAEVLNVFGKLYLTSEQVFRPQIVDPVECLWCNRKLDYELLHQHLRDGHRLPVGLKGRRIKCCENVGQSEQPKCLQQPVASFNADNYLRHFKDNHVGYKKLPPPMDVVFAKRIIDGIEFGPIHFTTGQRSDATRRKFQHALALELQKKEREGLVNPPAVSLNRHRKTKAAKSASESKCCQHVYPLEVTVVA